MDNLTNNTGEDINNLLLISHTSDIVIFEYVK